MKKTSLLFLAIIALISSAFIKPIVNESKPITVVIDAGHGGYDFGATSNDTYEKVIVSQIAEKVKSLNENKDITILFTRTSDEFITLDKRTNYINSVKPDLILSLHVNSSSDHQKSGVDFYVSNDSSFFEKSNEIANKLNQEFTKNTTLKVSDVKKAPYNILKKSDSPAVLIELGYLSNPNDKKYLTDDEEQNKIAKNIISFLSELK
ncbi:N-acetylmuramoyl-L-alanine amidase family protein [Flavobacterium aestivum]|uniref:N-acetylmuramoyl-L-alanine amidase family protein n=1 Tax=Flavobacterium aestivum TaxID=3003257 RepID=UPI0024824E1D|nr:N-acetylmuramoyl-L-alanine amidase [Flavobacterium aestivum]